MSLSVLEGLHVPLSIFRIAFSALRQKSRFPRRTHTHFPLWVPKGVCEAGETLECVRATSLVPYAHLTPLTGVVGAAYERNVVSCLRGLHGDTTDNRRETQSTTTPQKVVGAAYHVPMQHCYHVLGQRGARGGTPNMFTWWSRKKNGQVTQTSHVETRRHHSETPKRVRGLHLPMPTSLIHVMAACKRWVRVGVCTVCVLQA
jgi:hypothetical protein